MRSKNYSTKVPTRFEIIVRRPLFLSLLSKISCVAGLGKEDDKEKCVTERGRSSNPLTVRSVKHRCTEEPVDIHLPVPESGEGIP